MTKTALNQSEKNEARARLKVAQLIEEMKFKKLDWHSITHLSRDLNAVATAETRKHK